MLTARENCALRIAALPPPERTPEHADAVELVAMAVWGLFDFGASGAEHNKRYRGTEAPA